MTLEDNFDPDLFHNPDDMCPVCMEELDTTDATELHCGHVFHKECSQRWHAISPCCPLCRDAPRGKQVLTARGKQVLAVRDLGFSVVDLMMVLKVVTRECVHWPHFSSRSGIQAPTGGKILHERREPSGGWYVEWFNDPPTPDWSPLEYGGTPAPF